MWVSIIPLWLHLFIWERTRECTGVKYTRTHRWGRVNMCFHMILLIIALPFLLHTKILMTKVAYILTEIPWMKWRTAFLTSPWVPYFLWGMPAGPVHSCFLMLWGLCCLLTIVLPTPKGERESSHLPTQTRAVCHPSRTLSAEMAEERHTGLYLKSKL